MAQDETLKGIKQNTISGVVLSTDQFLRCTSSRPGAPRPTDLCVRFVPRRFVRPAACRHGRRGLAATVQSCSVQRACAVPAE